MPSVIDKPELSTINATNQYQLNRRSAITVFGVLMLLQILSFMDQQVLAAVLEMMIEDLKLTDTQAGGLQSALYLSTSLLSIPCAILVDRWSRRKAIGLMAVVWSLGTAATGLFSQFTHLAAARFAVGAGEAGFVPGSSTWLSIIFPKEKRGRIMGIYSMAIPIGLTLGAILGAGLAEMTGDWRTPFYAFAVPGVILGIVVMFLPDYATIKTGAEKTFSKEYLLDVLSIFKIKSLILAWLGIAMGLLVVFTMISWLPAMLIRAYGLSTAEAGQRIGLIFLVGIVSAPLGGMMADLWQRHSRRGRMLFLGTLMLVIAVTKTSLYYTMGDSLDMTMIIAIVDSLFSVMFAALAWTINADVSPARLRATSMGLNTLIGFMLGGAWGPVLAGVLSDRMGGGIIGLTNAGMIINSAAILSAIFFFIGSIFYPADSEKVNDEVMAER